MTLILTLVHRDYVLQSSDRLVSLAQRGELREGDRRANKCVIYRATDGVLSIGYAGYAYLGGMPADEWIVETLLRKPLDGPRTPDGRRFGIQSGASIAPLTAPQAAWEIEQAIRKAVPPDQHFEIVLAGFRQRRNRILPYWVDIQKRANDSVRVLNRSKRFPEVNGRYALIWQGGGVTATEMVELHERLRSLGKQIAEQHERNPNLKEVSTVMVQFTRDMADVHDGIGKNVLTVGLTQWGRGYCEFHGAERHPLRLVGNRSSPIEVVDSAQRPWIVSPGLLAAPSYEVGVSDFNLCGYEFRSIGADATGGLLGLSSSIRRPTIAEMIGRSTTTTPD
nr:hypothetical protein [Hyphomonas sp. 34-62-18]